jgi:predicted nucleic acid-binding protein
VDLLSGGADTPALLVMEASNAILEAGKDEHIGREDTNKATGVMLSLIGSNIKIHDEAELVPSAFSIAADHGLTTYDSVYLALAKKQDGSLASRDRRQIEAARTLGIKTVPT